MIIIFGERKREKMESVKNTGPFYVSTIHVAGAEDLSEFVGEVFWETGERPTKLVYFFPFFFA